MLSLWVKSLYRALCENKRDQRVCAFFAYSATLSRMSYALDLYHAIKFDLVFSH